MFLKPLLYLKKDIVIGLGEIGTPIYKLFSKSFTVEVYDINPKLIDKNLKILIEDGTIQKIIEKYNVPYFKPFDEIASSYTAKE